jgi:hypothetical protein
MTYPFTQSLRRTVATLALCAASLALASSPASARVFVGFGFGVPLGYPGWGWYPPPVYYPPPPVYYAPPAVYSPPQTYSQAPAPTGQQSCYAGPYVCPMDRPVASGTSCYCVGNGGQRIWGRAG